MAKYYNFHFMLEHARAIEDLVYELNTNLDTVKDTQSYMKAKNIYHAQGTFHRFCLCLMCAII